MALLTDIDDSYTKTGKGTLARWSNRVSLIPIIRNFGNFFGKIPFVSGAFGAVIGYIDTIIESTQWLLRGQVGSAATAALAGFVGTSANFASESTAFWWGNAASTALTGATIGTHARAATEAIIGTTTRALGIEPTIFSSNTAGIGSIRSSMQQAGPGKFASKVSAERGEDANAAYDRFTRGEGGAHINELQSANYRGA